MKHFGKLAVVCMSAALLLVCLAGCSTSASNGLNANSSSSSNTASSASSTSVSASSSGSSSASQVQEGTPLFTFIANNDPSMTFFIDDFEVSNITSLEYSRDNFETIVCTDADLIKTVFNGMAQIIVTGKYSGNEQVTDAMESATFNMADGQAYTVHFDFKKLVLDNVYYDTENRQPFTTAIIDLELASAVYEADIS